MLEDVLSYKTFLKKNFCNLFLVLLNRTFLNHGLNCVYYIIELFGCIIILFKLD